MDSYTGTAALVLQFLSNFKLKREKPGQYRCNSPLRPGSNSRSFLLKLDDSEHGTFFDHVDSDTGSLYDLAERLGIPTPNNSFSSYTTKYPHLESGKGLTLEQFSEHKQISISFLISLGYRQVIGKYGLPEIRIPYYNIDGSVFRERIRYALKAKDGSAWSEGQGLIPYGLERIKNHRWTIFVEGESDCITLWYKNLSGLGFPGASSVGCLLLEHIELLHTAFYWKEPDKGGETFSKKVVQRLSELGFTGECRELFIDGVKDISELYLRDPETFLSVLPQALENATLIPLPSPTPKIEVIENSDDFDTEELTFWPSPLEKAARYGVVGQIIEAIEPHTEADPAAMLMQFLVCFGSLIGKNPYYILDGSKHFTNLFLIVIGASATGRKGTSFQHIKNLLHSVDPFWSKNNIAEGLSSGEGLIFTVRDPVVGVSKEGTQIITDLGCDDKRLTIIESEFMNTLGVMTRQGNTLSAMLRRAWNGDTLATLTKNAPMKSSDPHISNIGHITKPEYLKSISKTETSNGFVNRFLHCVSKRSKSLPLGGELHTVDFAPIVNHLRKAADFARSVSQMRMDENAIQIWSDNYEHLVGEGKRTGLFADVTARATGHVVRISMIYALLDFSSVIRPVHLQAALECWRYSEDSAKYVFGNMSSDPISEKIFKALKLSKTGLTQTQIVALFQRNLSSSTIHVALGSLLDSGRISFRKEKTNDSSKKLSTIWFSLSKVSPD